jgi:hypothetical protein
MIEGSEQASEGRLATDGALERQVHVQVQVQVQLLLLLWAAGGCFGLCLVVLASRVVSPLLVLSLFLFPQLARLFLAGLPSGLAATNNFKRRDNEKRKEKERN